MSFKYGDRVKLKSPGSRVGHIYGVDLNDRVWVVWDGDSEGRCYASIDLEYAPAKNLEQVAQAYGWEKPMTYGWEKPMTVGELRKMLADIPDSAPILETRYSDFGALTHENLQVIEVTPQQQGAWYMRVSEHLKPTMDPQEVAKIIKALFFAGN